MTMLKIQQLASTVWNITYDEQKQVLGGGAGPHTKSSSKYSPTNLWSGYAGGTYDIGPVISQKAYFRRDNGKVVGVIDGSGKSLKLSNSNYDTDSGDTN